MPRPYGWIRGEGTTRIQRGLGADYSNLPCRTGGVCTPDPGVPNDWSFHPYSLGDGTYMPAYIDSQGQTWGLLGGTGYIQTARANGSQLFVSNVTGYTYGGPPAYPLASGVVGEPVFTTPITPVILQQPANVATVQSASIVNTTNIQPQPQPSFDPASVILAPPIMNVPQAGQVTSTNTVITPSGPVVPISGQPGTQNTTNTVAGQNTGSTPITSSPVDMVSMLNQPLIPFVPIPVWGYLVGAAIVLMMLGDRR